MKRSFPIVLVVVVVLVATLGVSRAAFAAGVPISSLPLGDDRLTPTTAIATVRFADVRAIHDNGFVTAMDQPVCVRSTTFGTGMGVYWLPQTDDLVVERLVEGDEPALERAQLDHAGLDLMNAKVLARGRVPLARVDNGSELPVYAYRAANAVHVLIRRGLGTSVDAFGDTDGLPSRAPCGFMHLLLATPESAVTEGVVLAEATPPGLRWLAELEDWEKWDQSHKHRVDPARFLVNVSVSKVSRDPGPILSVSVRAVPRPDAP